MGKLKIVNVEAFTKAEAATLIGFSQSQFDASIAYKNEEQPTGAELEAFCTDFLNKKVKGATNIVASITVESGIADTRERPYKVETIVTDGPRHYVTVYEGVIDTDKGQVSVFRAESKSEAEEAAKKYVTENKVDVTVLIKKEVDKGQATALVVRYTPSINTRKGKYIFFTLVD